MIKHEDMKTILRILSFIVLAIVVIFCRWLFLENKTNEQQPDFFTSLKVNTSAGYSVTALDLNSKIYFFSVGYEKGIIEFYNTKYKNNKITIKAHGARVSHLSSSKNDNIVASSSYFEEETKLWNPIIGDQIAVLPNTRGPEEFYLNSNNLILASGKNIKIYDTFNKKFYEEIYECDKDILSLSVSKLGNYIAAGTTGGVCVWDVHSLKNNSSFIDKIHNRYKIYLSLNGKEIISEPSDWVVSVNFTNDDKRLFITFRSGKVYSWQLGFLGTQRITTTKLKWLRYSIITDNFKIVIGTKNERGMGIGQIEYISEDGAFSEIIPQEIRTFAPVMLINNEQHLLVGASRKFLILPVQRYPTK